MPVKAGQRLDPEATKARILKAAAEVFTRRGIHAAGINEIVEAAGAWKLTVYKNFGSKDGLVEAVLTDRTHRVRAWQNHAVEQAGTGREKILAVFDLMANWYAEAGFRGCATSMAVSRKIRCRAAQGGQNALNRAGRRNPDQCGRSGPRSRRGGPRHRRDTARRGLRNTPHTTTHAIAKPAATKNAAANPACSATNPPRGPAAITPRSQNDVITPIDTPGRSPRTRSRVIDTHAG